MPNKYSHSGVLAQYCQTGFIALPHHLYLDYVSSSTLGSLTTQSQQSTTSTTSVSDDDQDQCTEPTSLDTLTSPSPDDHLAHHDQPGRTPIPPQTPQSPHFLFSHKSSAQDRAALVHSFINDIDNEPQPDANSQLYLGSDVDSHQPSQPPRRPPILIREDSYVTPSSNAKASHRSDRNAPKSSYPPSHHVSTSTASLAASATSSDYALDVPPDFPLHVGKAAARPHQPWTGKANQKSADVPVPQQTSNVNAHFMGRPSLDRPRSRQGADYIDKPPPRSANRPESREAIGKPDVPQRSANRPPSRQNSNDDGNVRNTVANVIHPASSYVSVPSQTATERPRRKSTSRNRNQQKTSEDNSMPSISDSVSETGVEVVENVALSSDYDNGVKIPEYEASAIDRLPPPQPALPAGSIIPRQASPPPAIGSNETRKIQPRRRDSNRPVSAISSDTQIYAPLSSTFPTNSTYTDEPAFIPEPNVVRPGSLPESAIERPPQPMQSRRSQSTIRGTSEQRETHTNFSYPSSDSGNEVGIPSVQPGLPPAPQPAPAPRRSRSSHKRDSRYTPVYRDRKAEWLADPANNVAHYREAFKLGQRHFALGGDDSDSDSVARKLNSLPGSIVAPRFPDAQRMEDFDVRPLSVSESTSESMSEAASEVTSSASSAGGFYPPDIPRYRDEIGSAGSGSGSPSGRGPRASVDVMSRVGAAPPPKPGPLRREDSGLGGGGSSSPSSSGGPPRGKEREGSLKKGKGLLKRLRGVSLTAGIR